MTRGSTLVTTNLPFDEWTEVFGSERLTGALLDREVFHTLLEVQVLTEQYRKTYKRIRPHSSLGYRPPAPEPVLPADRVPLRVSLTWGVVQPPVAGQDSATV